MSCPITVISGTGDPLFDLEDLLAWRETTRDNVSIDLVEAGHFTITEQRDEIIRVTMRDTEAARRHTGPVAVVGMACRFPGASSPAEFWELLRDGRTSVGPVPPDRETDPEEPIMQAGGFIDRLDLFDAAHFGFGAREAHRSDPRVRLLLMVAQEAIDDAGLLAADVAGPRTGIWVGESHSDYWDLSATSVTPNIYSLSGGGLKSFLAGRVSHFFDLQGPSITMDTSCSASLTAVHTACQALRDGAVDIAFAAGAHLILQPDGGPSHGLAKALSPRGRTAFASADADGYARAEGVGVVLLKRLSDALADNDPVHAVIEGTAINANGRTGHNIVTTSVPGQVRMMREALADAGCRPADIAYVEAHGPGTEVGDRVELTALQEVYGANPHPCLVGSVKTNIGHLEPSAGIAGTRQVRTRAPPRTDTGIAAPQRTCPHPRLGPFGAARTHRVRTMAIRRTSTRRRLLVRAVGRERSCHPRRRTQPDHSTASLPTALLEPPPVLVQRGDGSMTPQPSFRERMPVWAELDDLLDEPEFGRAVSGIAATYRRLHIFARTLGPALEIHDNPSRLIAGMEWAGQVDAPLMLAAMVHYAPVATAFRECGHPDDDLAALAAELDDMNAPGAFVATELGRGGSQVTMRTEARYHRERHTFTLHTPDDAALKIMPHVGWTGLPRTAVVNARLLVDGEDRGVHAFAFRFPHPLAPTATLPGSAPVPLDYAVIRFDGAEIPYGYWLRDTATITPDGVHDPLTPAQRLARSLTGTSTALVCVAVAMSAAARATVAITARFNLQRVAGTPTMPLLHYVTHRTELASALAQVYAISALTAHVGHGYVHEHGDNAGTNGHDAEATSYAPWASNNGDRMLTKVIATETLEAVAATSRRLCGAHGVIHANRISLYEGMARSFHPVAGDNRLLLLEAGKHLLTHGAGAHRRSAGQMPDSAVATPPFNWCACANGYSPTAYSATTTTARTGIRICSSSKNLPAYTPPAASWKNSEPPSATAPDRNAKRSTRYTVFTDSTHSWTRPHGTSTTARCSPVISNFLQSARIEAADGVHRHLNHLVDGLAVPPGRVGGFIGQDDYIHQVAAILP